MLITMYLHHSEEDNNVDSDADGIFTVGSNTTMLRMMVPSP